MRQAESVSSLQVTCLALSLLQASLTRHMQQPVVSGDGGMLLAASLFTMAALKLISCCRSSGGFKRQVTTMMPIGVPRVPYRTPKEGGWQWVDIWNCLVSLPAVSNHDLAAQNAIPSHVIPRHAQLP